MKNNKKTYFLIAGVIIALGVGAVYGKSSGKFLGSVKMTDKAQALPWWCISQEEWDKTHPKNIPGTSPESTNGNGTSVPKAGTPGYYIPGKPGGFYIDPSRPLGTQNKIDPKSSKTDTRLPAWKFIDPSTISKGKSGTGSSTGNNNTGNGTTAGNNGTGTGPKIPDVPIDPTKIPPEPNKGNEADTINIGYGCNCDETGKDIFISELGKNLKCPSAYGDSVTYNDETVNTSTGLKTKYKINLFSPNEAVCNSKYFCPEGSIKSWENISRNCNIQQMAYDRQCNNKYDKNMVNLCSIFEGKNFIKNLAEAGKTKFLCLSTEDCQKYLELAKNGTFTSTVKDKSFNDVANSCLAKNGGSDTNQWESWKSWFWNK